MHNLILYFNDTSCLIKEEDKIYTFTSSSIYDSQIQDSKEFINEFKTFIKENNIVHLFKIYKVSIYINSSLKEYLISYYAKIFEELNLNNITIESILDLLNKKKLYLITNNNSSYFIINAEIYKISNEWIFSILNNTTNNIYIFGNKEIKFNSKNVYLYTNHNTYIVDLL